MAIPNLTVATLLRLAGWLVAQLIEAGDRLLIVNDQRYAVITRGAPKHVDLVLKAAGSD
jgi:uncharacterized lipoprotein YbaY